MVVAIRDDVEPVSITIALILLHGELLEGERAPHRVNHDLPQPCQPLVGKLAHAPLAGRTCANAKISAINARLHLAVRRVVHPHHLVMEVRLLARLIGIGEGIENDASRLLGRHLVGSMFFEDDEPPGPWLPFAPHEPPRVRPPAPVQPVPDALERADLLVGHLALHDVREDVAASAHDIAEKLPAPNRLVDVAKVFRLLDDIADRWGDTPLETATSVYGL